jgi:hypothetical protein
MKKYLLLVVSVRPSPSAYDTSEDLNWAPETNKRITLKKKDITWPYDTRSEQPPTQTSTMHTHHQ